MKLKLAIVTSHPVQYNAPFFSLLAKSKKVHPKVFYTWGQTVLYSKFDPGFNKLIEWDIPLLEGYDYEFVENIAREKGSHHYKGIINPGIIKRITDWQPDALLIYGWKFHSHLKVLRYFHNKIPLWFRGDSVLLNDKKGVKSIFKNYWLKWIYRHVDVAIYCGTDNKFYFQKNGLTPEQLIPAFHAVDNERFENIAGRYTTGAKAWRNRLNIQATDLVFLFAGKLIPTKDISNLIKAFSIINKKKVHLVIVGNGPQENALKNTYAEVPNLHFLDFQNQLKMPVIYQLCDIFVLPSTGETWGLAVNEAMAAGKAILISDKCGGAKDLVKNGENGYIFKAGDKKDLFEKMLLVMEAGNDLKHMQVNSIKKIQNFTFQKFVEVIENLFDKDD